MHRQRVAFVHVLFVAEDAFALVCDIEYLGVARPVLRVAVCVRVGDPSGVYARAQRVVPPAHDRLTAASVGPWLVVDGGGQQLDGEREKASATAIDDLWLIARTPDALHQQPLFARSMWHGIGSNAASTL